MQIAGVADVIFAMFLLVVFSAVVLLISANYRVALGSFGAGIAFLLVGVWRFLPNSVIPSSGDDGYYLGWGADLAGALSGEAYEYGRWIWPGKGVWPVVIAMTHLIVKDAFLAPLTLSVIASISAVLVIHEATRLLLNNSYPALLAGLILLQPAFLGWGSSLNREAFFWLGSAFIVLGFAHFVRNRHLMAAFWTFAGAILVIGIRYEVGIPLVYLMVCAAIIFFLFGDGAFGQTFSAQSRLAVAFLVWIAASLGTLFGFAFARNPTLFLFVGEPESTGESPSELGANLVEGELRWVESTVSRLRDAVSGEQVTTAFQAADNLIIGTLLGFVRSFFGPFPQEMEPTLVWGILAIATLNFIAVLGLALVFLLKGGERALSLSGLTIAALGIMFIIGFSLTNYGMIARFRFTAQILLLPFAIGGFHLLRIKFNPWRGRARRS